MSGGRGRSLAWGGALLALTFMVAAAPASHDDHRAHAVSRSAPAEQAVVGSLSIPDVSLLNQEGQKVRFYSDLVKDKVVAINFIFTTCTTICPPMGANFASLQRLLRDRGGKEVQLISVSVDPAVDTPERLKGWASRFGAGPGWTLVTGPKPDVDGLLKALKVFTPDKNDHSPTVLVGDEARGVWTRVWGLARPSEMAAAIDRVMDEPGEAPDPDPRPLPAQAPGAAGPPRPAESGEEGASPARRYFTDVELVNQDGETMRLYSDLIEGKVVVVNTIFTTCTSICPLMSKTYAKLQEHLGDRLGRDVHLISISVDPENDTPELLKEFGRNFGARPGWYMLTGSSENVHLALRKFGHDVDQKESHKALMLIGNEPTGLWKKAFGLAPAEDIIAILDSVIRDDLEPAPGG